jgi:hypothetical protein
MNKLSSVRRQPPIRELKSEPRAARQTLLLLKLDFSASFRVRIRRNRSIDLLVFEFA